MKPLRHLILIAVLVLCGVPSTWAIDGADTPCPCAQTLEQEVTALKKQLQWLDAENQQIHELLKLQAAQPALLNTSLKQPTVFIPPAF